MSALRSERCLQSRITWNLEHLFMYCAQCGYTSSALKMEAVCSAEILVPTYRIIRCNDPEDCMNMSIFVLNVLTAMFLST